MTLPHTLAFVVFGVSAYMQSKPIVHTPTGCSCVLDYPMPSEREMARPFLRGPNRSMRMKMLVDQHTACARMR